MRLYYKIVEAQKDGIYTLFHPINSTRKLPINKWVTGCIREGVRDGSGQRYYTSGIHIIDGYEAAVEYLKRFRRQDRIIVPCYAKNLRRKEHSRHPVYLAEKIKILS